MKELSQTNICRLFFKINFEKRKVSEAIIFFEETLDLALSKISW